MRLPIPILALAFSLVGGSALAAPHDVHTQLSTAGIATISDNLADALPGTIDVGDLEVGLFDCGDERATITQSGTVVDLDVTAASLRSDAGGLALDVTFSATASGSLRLYKVLVCTGDMTCSDTATATDVGASIRLALDASGALVVTDVDVALDPDNLDITVADCAAGTLTTALAAELESLGILLVESAVERLAADKVAPLLAGLIDGVANHEASLGVWDVTTAMTELDLSDGVRLSGEVDMTSSIAAPSCMLDPGEPARRVGARPAMTANGEHLGVALNLGVIDDLLYHLWRSGVRCDGVTVDGSALGAGRALTINLEAPLSIEPDGDDLIIVAPDIAMVVSDGDASAELSVEAHLHVAIGVEGAALAAYIERVEIPRIAAADPAAAARDGFDVARIRQTLASDLLPSFFSGAVLNQVRFPLGVNAAGLYAILRDVRATSAHLVAAADLFFPPATDNTAPETAITSAPTRVVRPEDAIVVVTATDPEIPTELLTYRATANGIELAAPRFGKIAIGARGVTDTYEVTVAAIDLAGNTDASPARTTVTVDGIRPTVEVAANAAGNTASVDVSATDDLTAAAALRTEIVIERLTGDGDVEVHRGPGASGIALEPGETYRVTARVTDEAGNVGVASATLSVGAGGCSIAGPSDAAAALALLLLVLAARRPRRARRAALLIPMLIPMLGASGCASEPTARVPACASPLAQAVWDSMEPVAHNGTVPMELALSTATRVDPDLYITGPAIFGKWAELIAGAEHAVNMQFYKWEPSTDPTETILAGIEELADRRRAAGATTPIPVRIVIDTSAIGVAAPIASEHMPVVTEQFARYDLDPSYVDVEFAVRERNLLDQFGNIHVKSVVVDGRVSMLTGANPEAQHNFDQPWHDIAAVFHGEIASAMLADFDSSWDDATVWTCGPGERAFEPGACLRATEPVEHVFDLATSLSGNASCAVMALTRGPASFLNNDVDNPQDQAYLAAFANAERVIKIETPNINDDAAKTALLDAASRGVKVKLITSLGFNELAQQPVGGPNGQNVDELYRQLELRGIADPCAVFEVRWYAHQPGVAIEGNGPYASHVKYASFDDQLVIVGTTNMDTASWNFSHELNLAVDDPAVTASFDAALFDADWERAVPVAQCQ